MISSKSDDTSTQISPMCFAIKTDGDTLYTGRTPRVQLGTLCSCVFYTYIPPTPNIYNCGGDDGGKEISRLQSETVFKTFAFAWMMGVCVENGWQSALVAAGFRAFLPARAACGYDRTRDIQNLYYYYYHYYLPSGNQRVQYWIR